MNIVYNGQQKTHEFREVATGDVFMFKENLYMRIQNVSSCDGLRYNAVTLKDGFLMTFKDTDNVVVIDADLVIK